MRLHDATPREVGCQESSFDACEARREGNKLGIQRALQRQTRRVHNATWLVRDLVQEAVIIKDRARSILPYYASSPAFSGLFRILPLNWKRKRAILCWLFVIALFCAQAHPY